MFGEPSMSSSPEIPRPEGRLVLIGWFGPEHIGRHFRNAAISLGIETTCLDFAEAFRGPKWAQRASWHLFGHRPLRLGAFGRHVIEVCRATSPTWVLATGIAPLSEAVLRTFGALGTTRLNFLTDDPFNPALRAPWFLSALPLYDHVFSPRHANIEDLRSLGCQRVSYLPFAYEPSLHFRDPETPDVERPYIRHEVLFAGGADDDRVDWVRALRAGGFDIGLYGGYWDRYRETGTLARGILPPDELRRVAAAAKVSVALVRRANRDGHAMRSYELPAMGAAIVAEDTADHRALFGEEGVAVLYFSTTDELVQKTRWLLDHDEERRRMAERAHDIVVCGANTYRDRLAAMLSLETTDRRR